MKQYGRVIFSPNADTFSQESVTELQMCPATLWKGERARMGLGFQTVISLWYQSREGAYFGYYSPSISYTKILSERGLESVCVAGHHMKKFLCGATIPNIDGKI